MGWFVVGLVVGACFAVLIYSIILASRDHWGRG